MKNITIDQIRPGMVLASEVRSSKGRWLLDQGLTLEDNHLRILNMWGVTEVCVEDETADSPCARDAALLETAEGLVRARFGECVIQDAPTSELRRQCVLLCADRLAEGWRPQPLPAEPETGGELREPVPSLESLTSDDDLLATLPDIYLQINTALEDPACTAARLADIISKDTGMSAKLLRLVNSPALGRGQKVDTLSRGVVLLGLKELSQLALGLSVMTAFKDVPDGLFPVAEFWKHSLACGVLAGLLALRLGRRELERFFVAGLLHDVGRLVMLRRAPGAVVQATRMAGQRRMPLREAERAVFGFDHCRVAERLMHRWGLPETLTGIIVAHHDPLQWEKPQDAAVLSVANDMAIALEFGCSGQHVFTGLESGAWELLGLPVGVQGAVIAQARRQLNDIVTTFLG